MTRGSRSSRRGGWSSTTGWSSSPSRGRPRLKATGAFGLRIAESWTEIRENMGRSALQALGVMVGVASVLGGFSISDSHEARSDERWRKLGGMERLNVQPAAAIKDGTPSALQSANLGLRRLDADEGEEMDRKAVHA